MGRYSCSNKTEADNLRKIKTSFLKKHGYFRSLQSGLITWTSHSGDQNSVGIEVSIYDEGYLRIHYTQTKTDTGEKQDFDYKAPLTTTPCHFGGKRYWFICPLSVNNVYCGKRVGVLYKNGDYFGCRHCYNLTYSSKKECSRGKYSHIFNILKTECKIDERMENIKRLSYAGKPTRKYRKVLKMENRLMPLLNLLHKHEEL